jgi:hypothetical protein
MLPQIERQTLTSDKGTRDSNGHMLPSIWRHTVSLHALGARRANDLTSGNQIAESSRNFCRSSPRSARASHTTWESYLLETVSDLIAGW